jgi:hypothetical protein
VEEFITAGCTSGRRRAFPEKFKALIVEFVELVFPNVVYTRGLKPLNNGTGRKKISHLLL